ncbi:MAG: C4-dicarboxylate ABC transporter permease [Thiothrix nivea]|nr:MAG: C4-dicarboxylate ABC transporter permease [Thiothrix nivea]
MTRLRRLIYGFSSWGSGICLIAMTCLILSQIVARMMGVLIPSSEDFAGWLLCATIFLGLAYTFNSGGHIRLTILLGRLSGRFRYGFELFALLVGIAIVAYLAYYTCYTVYESYDFEDVTDTYLSVPLWMVQFPMALGSVLLLFSLVDALISTLRGQTPSYMAFEEQGD